MRRRVEIALQNASKIEKPRRISDGGTGSSSRGRMESRPVPTAIRGSAGRGNGPESFGLDHPSFATLIFRDRPGSLCLG